MGRLSLFVDELRRRNVIRTGVAFVFLAWLILQVADIILPVFNTPTWVPRLMVALLAIGFPISLLLAWVFEITASGVKRTEDVTLEDSITHLTGRKLDYVVIGFLITALSLSLYANVSTRSESEEPPDPVSILIADFTNDTGNEIYTGVLEDALRIGVEVTRFIEAYPRRDARQLALEIGPSADDSKPLATKAAREVAIRQGIDIVVSGIVRKNAKNITVEIVGLNPADQKLLFELSQSADSEDEVLAAIASLAQQVRTELGDTKVDHSADDTQVFAITNLNAASEYLFAEDLRAARNLDEAVTHFSRAIELDPGLTHAYIGRAISRHSLGMSELAAKDWELVMSRLDNLTERDRLRTLGNYYATVPQDWHQALETYERLVDRYPADSAGQNNVAVAAFYNLDFERARSAGRKVVERYPGHSLYKANLALYAMYAGESDEAYSLAQETILQDPQNALGWVAAALTESKAGHLADARDTYRRMMEIGQEGRSRAYEGLADLALYEQDYDLAAEILVEGIDFDLGQNANDTAAVKLTTLAEVYLQSNHRQDALEAIEHGLRIGTSDNSKVRAAMLLAELGEFDKAGAIANELLNDLSSIRRAYAGAIRARIASLQNQSVEAVEFSKTAIEIADLWLARLVLGNVYLDAGFPVEAYNEFQICKNRIGEGLSVFLDDRPTFRITRDLEAAIDRTKLMLKQPDD